jgi:hypothetical protein
VCALGRCESERDCSTEARESAVISDDGASCGSGGCGWCGAGGGDGGDEVSSCRAAALLPLLLVVQRPSSGPGVRAGSGGSRSPLSGFGALIWGLATRKDRG